MNRHLFDFIDVLINFDDQLLAIILDYLKYYFQSQKHLQYCNKVESYQNCLIDAESASFS